MFSNLKFFLADLPIARKLFLAFGTVCLLSTLGGLAGYLGLERVNLKASEASEHGHPSFQALAALRIVVSDLRRADLALLLCKTDTCHAHFEKIRGAALEQYQRSTAVYNSMLLERSDRELFSAFEAVFMEYMARSSEATSELKAGHQDVAFATLVGDPTLDLYVSATDKLEKEMALNTERGDKAALEGKQVGQIAEICIAIVMLVIVLLCALIGIALTHLIADPVRTATAALEKVAAKDLTVSVPTTSSDEIGRMCAALNTSVAAMRSLLASVSQGTENLSASASQMSTRSVESNHNAQAQSDKTIQIAAAAQQMTATIGEISHNAEAAANASRSSAQMASEGGAVMEAAAGTMQRISAATKSVAEKMKELASRSEDIGKVVTVIHDISEQTNLLALNAAIEAARAGEHGRGFAVVAGEVRRLAERTRSATEEIAGTIRSIQAETRQTLDLMAESHRAVDSGIGETGRARQSLEAIIDSARQVEHMIHLIATAATEQTSASSEISESASYISKLASDNSHAAEETAIGCQQLSLLASELDFVIRQFRLDGHIQRAADHSFQVGQRSPSELPKSAYRVA